MLCSLTFRLALALGIRRPSRVLLRSALLKLQKKLQGSFFSPHRFPGLGLPTVRLDIVLWLRRLRVKR